MRLTPFGLALFLGAALATAPACLAQNPPDAMSPDPNAPAPDPAQTSPAPDAGQAAPQPADAPPAPTPPAPAPEPPPAATAPPPAAPAPPAAPPAAQPEAKPADPLANVLGPEVKMLGYSIRPPKDFTFTSQPFPTAGRRDFVWQGGIHQDGCVTSLIVGIKATSTTEANPEREFLIGFFKGLYNRMSDVVMSPSEPITVGGLPAHRATWTGKCVARKRLVTLQGFIYVIRDGTIRLSIMGVDSYPNFATTFPAMNASVLSFHK